MRKQIYILCCLIFILFYSCQKRLVLPAPEQSVQTEKAELPLSELALTLHIPYKSIENALERKQGNLIYEDDSYANNNQDNIKITVLKTGPFRFKGYKEFIQITLPLNIYFAGLYKACAICPAIESSTRFDAEISFTTRLGLQKNWTIITQTNPGSFRITKDPYIKVGPLQINVKRVVEYALEDILKDLAADIDRGIQYETTLRKQANEMWKMIQNPIEIDSAYKAWIRFIPRDFIMAPIECNNDQMTLNGALKTRIITSFGEMPSGRVIPLPYLTLDQPSKEFNVELEIEIPFTEATSIARNMLKDSIFHFGKKRYVKIDDLEIFGTNSEIFIKVFSSGSLNAIFYLKGKPAYDMEKQELFLADLDYELRTRQHFIKSANWLLKSSIRNKLEKAFRYNVSKDYEAANHALAAYLQNYSYEDLFVVNGKINSLQLKSVQSDQKRIYALFSAKGKAGITLKNIEF